MRCRSPRSSSCRSSLRPTAARGAAAQADLGIGGIAVTTSKSFLVRLMLSDEISITEMTNLKAVKDGGGPLQGILGGSGMASRDQTGATDGSGRPLAISPTAFRKWAAPWPSNTRWLKQMPTVIPPHLNTSTGRATAISGLAKRRPPGGVLQGGVGTGDRKRRSEGGGAREAGGEVERGVAAGDVAPVEGGCHARRPALRSSGVGRPAAGGHAGALRLLLLRRGAPPGAAGRGPPRRGSRTPAERLREEMSRDATARWDPGRAGEQDTPRHDAQGSDELALDDDASAPDGSASADLTARSAATSAAAGDPSSAVPPPRMTTKKKKI
ncbi:hypothetical protein ACMD2_01542 [Ananas comosus]|uniref:Uncharacterized protein n=1 Tax=Ananas comosus TaxID=4615 RepID=A0A199W0L7_ANACO|nr:hypothetical protein ACMD2_01542 [Ananas comosus]